MNPNANEVDTVRVTRIFGAAPDRVFRAWIEPALLRLWLAPVAQAEPRPGGRYRLEISKPEGDHVVTGEYTEFVPAEKLAMTWVYSGPMAPGGGMVARLTVDFKGENSHTEVSLCHDRLTNPSYLEAIRTGAWTNAFEVLDRILADPSW